MQWKINLTQFICLQMGKTTKAKPHQMILRLQLPRIYYYQSQAVISIRNLTKPFGLSQNTNLQLNPYPNTQLDLYYSDNLLVQCTNPNTWLLRFKINHSPRPKEITHWVNFMGNKAEEIKELGSHNEEKRKRKKKRMRSPKNWDPKTREGKKKL